MIEWIKTHPGTGWGLAILALLLCAWALGECMWMSFNTIGEEKIITQEKIDRTFLFRFGSYMTRKLKNAITTLGALGHRSHI